MTEQTKPSNVALDRLPRMVRITYQVWRSGENCKQMMPNSTFYHHRCILLAHGVDISIPCYN